MILGAQEEEQMRAELAADEYVLLEHIRTLIAGRTGVAPRTQEKLAYLSPRVQEVVRLMVRGASNKQIAAQLGIDLTTVRSHIKAALRATGVQSRVELIVLYFGVEPYGWEAREKRVMGALSR